MALSELRRSSVVALYVAAVHQRRARRDEGDEVGRVHRSPAPGGSTPQVAPQVVVPSDPPVQIAENLSRDRLSRDNVTQLVLNKVCKDHAA